MDGLYLKGGGGRSRTYKRQFTVFLIVIIEAIYTVEPRGPELQLAGSIIHYYSHPDDLL